MPDPAIITVSCLLALMVIVVIGISRESGKVIKTTLVTTGGSMLPCKLIVRPSEILVVSNQPTIVVPVNQLESCLYHDQIETAGFSIEYNFGQLIFFEKGYDSGDKVRKAVNLVSETHANWYKGTSIPPIPVVNMSTDGLIESDQLVHHPNQG